MSFTNNPAVGDDDSITGGGFMPSPASDLSPAGLHGHWSPHAQRYRDDHASVGVTTFSNTRQPSAGAQSYAYLNHRVIQQPVIGGGVAAQMQYKSIQPPQVYVQAQAVLTSGLGGLINGQYVGQALIDPYA